jgi:hypothetical protein
MLIRRCVLLGLALGLALPVNAQPVHEGPALPPSFKVGNRFSRGVQTVTGVRFIVRRIAEREIAKALTPQFQKRPTVHLQLYSAGDLLAGKLKGIHISGEHLMLGVPFTRLDLRSETPIWLNLKGKPRLRQPVQTTFEGHLTEADVNRMLAQRPTKLTVKLPAFGEQTLLALTPNVTLNDNTLHLNTTLIVPGAPPDTGVPLSVQGQLRPNAQRDRLAWHGLSISSSVLQDPAMVSQFVEQQFGRVLSFSSQRVNGHPLKVSITESQIRNHQWVIRAKMTVLPPKP